MVKYFEETPNKILKINEHVDGGWFWSKYSVNPYIGCEWGCSYCFLRMNEYGLKDFSKNVRVMTNSPELFEKELGKRAKDVVLVSGYGPVEAKYGLTRKILKTIYEKGFPVIIVTKSPLVIRDLDLIKKISEKSWACVVVSINSTDEKYRKCFEKNTPSFESRFGIINRLSSEGIYCGISLTPVIPFITDSESNLKNIIHLTKENGGDFVMAGGLILGNSQATHFYNCVGKYDKNLVNKLKKLYFQSYSPRDDSWSRIGRLVRNFCCELGLDYRIKRYIPNSEISINKVLSERLFLKVYEMELEEKGCGEIDYFRNLAFKIDELENPVSEEEFRKIESKINP